MANNRVFYACQAVAVAECFVAHDDDNTRTIHGLQSVGITTNFNLEQAFELGQIQIYENIEGLPDVEVTLEKVLDGYPLIYHLCTPGVAGSSLVNRSAARVCVGLGIYPDTEDAVTGDAPNEVYMSGMYLSSLSYTVPTEGNATESVTLVGNNKSWSTSPKLVTSAQALEIPEVGGAGTDKPFALAGSGGIQRRENFNLTDSTLPASIKAGLSTFRIQNFTCSTDFSREDILQLGSKVPYYRAPNFPIEVTSEFEVISLEKGDQVFAEEAGLSSYVDTVNEGNNTSEESIRVILDDSTDINLGSSNRLSSVTYGGGDATGGNATITYSFTNFNDLDVRHNEDPARGTIGYSVRNPT